MAVYDVEITKETSAVVSFRVLSEGTEVLSGSVDRWEFEAARRSTGKDKAEVLFDIARARMPEVFPSGTVKSPTVGVPVEPVETVEVNERTTVDAGETAVSTVAPHAHAYAEYSDLAVLREELSKLRDPRVDALVNALATHNHPAYTLEAHDHPLVDARVSSVERNLEFQVAHQHPHVHPAESHSHPEFKQLSDALVALAEELRTTRLTFLGHDHKHRHDELEDKFVDHLAWASEHGHPHDHPLATHEHPPVDHLHTPHEHYDPRVETLESEVAALKARPIQHAELRVLSRENRGGHDIIIAEEIQ